MASANLSGGIFISSCSPGVGRSRGSTRAAAKRRATRVHQLGGGDSDDDAGDDDDVTNAHVPRGIVRGVEVLQFFDGQLKVRVCDHCVLLSLVVRALVWPVRFPDGLG